MKIDFWFRILDEEHILIGVSDGMGGHFAGDVAASDVIDCSAKSKTNDDTTVVVAVIENRQ